MTTRPDFVFLDPVEDLPPDYFYICGSYTGSTFHLSGALEGHGSIEEALKRQTVMENDGRFERLSIWRWDINTQCGRPATQRELQPE